MAELETKTDVKDTETKEQENINKLVDFLKNECSEIHAILFILKSSTNRLTPFQISIFNKMMNLFGKDAEQNFTVLFTFKRIGFVYIFLI